MLFWFPWNSKPHRKPNLFHWSPKQVSKSFVDYLSDCPILFGIQIFWIQLFWIQPYPEDLFPMDYAVIVPSKNDKKDRYTSTDYQIVHWSPANIPGPTDICCPKTIPSTRKYGGPFRYFSKIWLLKKINSG